MKTKRRQPGIKSAPMLIMRGLVNDRLEIRERMAVEAFSSGWATIEHFDTIADMQGVLLLAGSTSEKRKPAMLYARDTLGTVLGSIRERYLRTGKMGCNGDELKVLRGFVSLYRDFWMKQPLALYETACAELQRVYDQMAKNADEKQKKEAA
jgi:hypothetical protein